MAFNLMWPVGDNNHCYPIVGYCYFARVLGRAASRNALPADPTGSLFVTGVIVLGGALNTRLTSDWGQPQVNGYADQLITFMTLARQFPNARLVFSGGTEADEVRSRFASMGMDAPLQRPTLLRMSGLAY